MKKYCVYGQYNKLLLLCVVMTWQSHGKIPNPNCNCNFILYLLHNISVLRQLRFDCNVSPESDFLLNIFSSADTCCFPESYTACLVCDNANKIHLIFATVRFDDAWSIIYLDELNSVENHL